MNNRILIAYDTLYGTTAEVAARVAAGLREAGLEVDCRRMRDLQAIDDYRAVILGAPFYYGRWPRPARHFLSRFGPELAQRDVAIFATGQIDSLQTEEEAHAQLYALTAHYDWLRPFDLAMFGGCWDPRKLKWRHRLLLRLPASGLGRLPGSDLRNWPAIDKWSTGLAELLKSRVAQPSTPKPEITNISRADAPLDVMAEYIADQQLPPHRHESR